MPPPLRYQHESVIGVDVHIAGDLTSGASLTINGTVEGTVESKGKVTLGPQGFVRGQIRAASVDVMGAVEGHLQARVIEIRRNARVHARIEHETVSVAVGSEVIGCFQRADTSDIGGAEEAADPKSGPAAQ